jgi:hypothetical protein
MGMEENGFTHLIGHAALVEAGGSTATGSVTGADDSTVTVTCDDPAWTGQDSGPVQVSVFSPDALYRLSGPSTVKEADVILGPYPDVERIQRRRWPRRRLDLAVTVCPVEDGRRLEGVPGRTVDIGVGGLCVETLRPVEGEGDPMVILSLPDGTSIVALTATVGAEDLGDGWRYRFAFRHLEAHDAGRIADLVS